MTSRDRVHFIVDYLGIAAISARAIYVSAITRPAAKELMVDPEKWNAGTIFRYRKDDERIWTADGIRYWKNQKQYVMQTIAALVIWSVFCRVVF